jgi:hypothetical protein
MTCLIVARRRPTSAAEVIHRYIYLPYVYVYKQNYVSEKASARSGFALVSSDAATQSAE